MTKPDTQSTVEAVKRVVSHIERHEGQTRFTIADWQLEELDRIAALAAQPRDDVREAWQPISDYPTDSNGRPIEAVRDDCFLLVIAPELLDEDFNPTGIGQAHYQDDGTVDEHVEPGAWVAPQWCNCHDEYHLRVVNPTHFMLVRKALSTDSGPTEEQAASDGVEERAAFIRLLDAADRFNGVISVRDKIASPYQGQLILAVRNAYSVLGIGRTEKHEPLRTPDERDRALEEELAQVKARYEWAANELLACDYGDNPTKDLIGWTVYGWRVKDGTRTIYGPSIDEAIDAVMRTENAAMKEATQ